ncbi:MAG: replication-relaxation family protein [Rhizomicrobium sp.]
MACRIGTPAILHSLMICETLASLELGMTAAPGLRFITWPEILGRAPQAVQESATPFRMPLPSGGFLVPDGVFGIEYRQDGSKAYRFFALETDRGTMPLVRSSSRQTSYMAKLAAYRELIAHQVYKKHWGVPNLLVLTVTNSELRMIEMLKRLAGMGGESAAFLFKAVDASVLKVPAMGLPHEPWARAGLPPIRIDE